MTPEAVDQAVRELLQARRTMTRIPGLPAACCPNSMGDAYIIQKALIDRIELPVAGWKIGCTSEVAQRILGVAEPMYGPVFASAVIQSPAALPSAALPMMALECEFAFRLRRDLLAGEGPFGRDQVIQAVGAVIPAIEVISTRLDDFAKYGGPQIVADCGANGALVLGEPEMDWEDMELDSHPVSLAVDGVPRATGAGNAVLGHPLNAMIWFVNHFTEAGEDLHAGDVISTGTCTGLLPISAGETAVADFGCLGLVQIRFEA